MNPSWGWSWLRVGITGKLVVKMNIPVAVRNATTRERCSSFIEPLTSPASSVCILEARRALCIPSTVSTVPLALYPFCLHCALKYIYVWRGANCCGAGYNNKVGPYIKLRIIYYGFNTTPHTGLAPAADPTILNSVFAITAFIPHGPGACSGPYDVRIRVRVPSPLALRRIPGIP